MNVSEQARETAEWGGLCIRRVGRDNGKKGKHRSSDAGTQRSAPLVHDNVCSRPFRVCHDGCVSIVVSCCVNYLLTLRSLERRAVCAQVQLFRTLARAAPCGLSLGTTFPWDARIIAQLRSSQHVYAHDLLVCTASRRVRLSTCEDQLRSTAHGLQ